MKSWVALLVIMATVCLVTSQGFNPALNRRNNINFLREFMGDRIRYVKPVPQQRPRQRPAFNPLFRDLMLGSYLADNFDMPALFD